MLYICDIAQGDTAINRTGSTVLPRFQSINLTLQKNITANAPEIEVYRIMLFRYWGEGTEATPLVEVSDVLQGAQPYSFLNADNTGGRGERERRIEVHKSKFFQLDKIHKPHMTYKWNVKVNGLNKKTKDHIKFASSATEQPVSGGFYLLVISDNGVMNEHSVLSFNSKINFYDN